MSTALHTEISRFTDVPTREQFVASPQNEGVFFDTDSYVEGPPIPLTRLTEDVTTFMAEMLMKSTKRYAYYSPDDNEWYHPDGLPYSEFFDRAITKFAHNPTLRARFEAEKLGYERARLYAQNFSSDDEDTTRSFVIESQPGDVYRNGTIKNKTKSVHFESTYIADRTLQLGSLPERTYKEFEFYAIPTDEMTVDEHWMLVEGWSDVRADLALFHMYIENVDSASANELVSLPFRLIQSLDVFAQNLGYRNFNHIEDEATHMLELDNDAFAYERRLDMITYFVERMHTVITDTALTYTQKKLRLRAYGITMRNYFASETGAEYLGKTFEEIQPKIEGHSRVEIRRLGAPLTYEEWQYTDWAFAEDAEAEYFVRLHNNPEAQRRRNSIACVRIADTTQDFLSNANDPYSYTTTDNFDYFTNSTSPYDYFTNQTDNKSEKLEEGQSTCYPCPVCQKEGSTSVVHLRGGYLVCASKPDEHRLKYDSSD